MQNNPLFSTVYLPPKFQPIIGAVQLVHDMSEHQKRYIDFSEFLSEKGYVVITSDMKGHGSNLKRESEIGYLGDYNLNNPIGYVHEISAYIKDKFSNIPYMLIGQGLGALICISYFKRYDYFIDELILCSPIEKKNISLDKAICNGLIAAKGDYYRSKFLEHFIKCDRSRENAEYWLSDDSSVIDDYKHDRSCGFTYTLNGYKAILSIIDDAYVNGSWIRKNLHVPIKVIAGDKGLISDNKLNVIKKLFENQEYDNVECQRFKTLRHDILNGDHAKITRNYLLQELDKLQLQ